MILLLLTIINIVKTFDIKFSENITFLLIPYIYCNWKYFIYIMNHLDKDFINNNYFCHCKLFLG